ncbi:MAG: hypothetical protein ACRDOK_14945 [Streptosporangiaceae bacterium]
MPELDVLGRLFSELATADLPVPVPASVVARGRQRRRRAHGRTVIAAAVVAGVVVAPTPRGGADRQSARPACRLRARTQRGADSELRHALQASHQQSVSVIGVSPNRAVRSWRPICSPESPTWSPAAT